MKNKSQLNELKVPKLRFKGFNNQYEEFILSEITNFMKSGGTPKSNDSRYYTEGEGIPFLSIPDMKSKYLMCSKKFINKIAIDETATFIFPANNLLISIYATIGNICINKIDVALPQSILGIKFNNNVNLEYAYYLFTKNKNKFTILQQIGSQPNISLNIVKKIKFTIPDSLEEQQKIAKFFSLLDKQIELWERKLQLSELILRVIAHIITRLLYKSCKIKLKNYIKISNKEPIDNLLNTTLISIQLWGKGFKKSNLKPKISSSGRPYYIRKPNELIIGSQNFHNGSVAILGDEYNNPIMSSAIFSFDVFNIHPNFLEFVLLLPKYQHYLQNRCVGTGQKEFSIKAILDLDFFEIDSNLNNNFTTDIMTIKHCIGLIKKTTFLLKKKRQFFLNNLFI